MRIGIALIFVVTVFMSGCASTKSTRSFSVTTQVRGMDLRDLQSSPGTAECGCTYSVTW